MSDKFVKEYNLGNINEFYEGLESSLNSKITKFRVWCDYYTEIQRQKELMKFVLLITLVLGIITLVTK